MSVKYPNCVNLTSSNEEQPNERTHSPPPRKKSLSPPQASTKSISSKSTHYTSSSLPSESQTLTHVAPPPKLRYVIPIKQEHQELPPLQISPNDPYAQTMDNWPLGPFNPSSPPRVTRQPLETLILKEESRSKMIDKQNDPILIKQKVNISPIDYLSLNKIKEEFGKRFVTQKELSAEQAFWLKHSNYNPDTSIKSHTPVKIEAPSELPKLSLDTFNVFDKTLLDEITEVQIVFNKMEAAVDQCSVDKNAFEIQNKQLSIDNDQLLNQIMSQEIVHIAVNSIDNLNVNKSCVDECNKCLELETGLLKRKI
nr:hypothetical protein [Tanacetum cinerariifolium]